MAEESEIPDDIDVIIDHGEFSIPHVIFEPIEPPTKTVQVAPPGSSRNPPPSILPEPSRQFKHPPEYPGDPPLFCPKALTPRAVQELLLNPGSISGSKIGFHPPSGRRLGDGTYVIDVSRMGSVKDIKVDQLGAWGKYASKYWLYILDGKRAVRTEERGDFDLKIICSYGNVTSSNGGLLKSVFELMDGRNRRKGMAVVTYKWKQGVEPYEIYPLPHGNRKRGWVSYQRKFPSTLQHRTKRPRASHEEEEFADQGEERVSGELETFSCSNLLRDRWKSTDKWDRFGRLMGEQLRELGPHTETAAVHKIHQVLVEARIAGVGDFRKAVAGELRGLTEVNGIWAQNQIEQILTEAKISDQGMDPNFLQEGPFICDDLDQ